MFLCDLCGRLLMSGSSEAIFARLDADGMRELAAMGECTSAHPDHVLEAAPILRRELIDPTAFLWTLHAPGIAARAKPGQFVHIRVDEGFWPLLRRPISIMEADPREGTLLLYIRAVGLGTERMLHWPPGHIVDLMGPLGVPFDAPHEDERHVYYVSGGIGLAPVWMHYLALREAGSGKREAGMSPTGFVTLGSDSVPASGSALPAPVSIGFYWGVRTAAQIIPRLTGAEPPVTIAVQDGSHRGGGILPPSASHLWRRHDAAPMVTGTVVDAFDADWQRDGRPSGVLYACGPHGLFKALQSRYRDAPLRLRFSMENYMGCALGACQGCSVKVGDAYQRVCVEGPVFDGRLVQL